MLQLDQSTDVMDRKEKHYLVLSVSDVMSEDILQCLTSRVMQWNDRTWIMDLSPCLMYWQKQARRKGCEWQELIRQIIEQGFSEDGFIATLSHHPWAGLLLASDMQAKNLKGFVDLSHRFTQNLYQQVSWDSWLQVASQIGEHFTAHKVRRFSEQSLRTNLEHLRRTIERLGFTRVSDLSGTDSYAIKRRFGSVVKNLWQWSEGDFSESSRDLFYDFPWQSFKFRTCPAVIRHLDHAIYQWDHISPHLRDDLNRLCALPQWSAQDKVLCLEWKVVLHDLKTLMVPIGFRHPHSLHQDSPDQKTALLQAYYRFQERMEDYAASLEEFDEFKKPLIISWTLQVSETLRMPEHVVDIFGDRSSDEQALAGLENRVSVPLLSYELTQDHQPEDMYDESYKVKDMMAPHERSHFLCLAQLRPLFIYKKPRRLRSQKSKLWRFLERSMNKWWQDSMDESCIYRDYYQMTDENNRRLWVYKNSAGKWFIHGIFA